MENIISNQIYIVSIDSPFESINSIFNNSKLILKLFESPIAKIKTFLGSNLNIDGSGYLWQGKNGNSFSVESSSTYSANFSKSFFFKILYINNICIKEDISIEMNIYKNTDNNSSIIEFCFSYLYYNNDVKLLKNKILGFEIKDFLKIGCYNIINYVKESKDLISINHSLLLNMNYKSAYKILRDFNITAKALGADKLWKIKYKKNSIYSVNMNNGINMDFHIYKEEENGNKSKKIFYHKYRDNIPSLNEWINCYFYNIAYNKCFLIYETKIPINLASKLNYTIYNYTLYVIRKWKIFVEYKLISSSE